MTFDTITDTSTTHAASISSNTLISTNWHAALLCINKYNPPLKATPYYSSSRHCICSHHGYYHNGIEDPPIFYSVCACSNPLLPAAYNRYVSRHQLRLKFTTKTTKSSHQPSPVPTPSTHPHRPPARTTPTLQTHKLRPRRHKTSTPPRQRGEPRIRTQVALRTLCHTRRREAWVLPRRRRRARMP